MLREQERRNMYAAIKIVVIVSILVSTVYNVDIPKTRIVLVEDYCIPVLEEGRFYLYEKNKYETNLREYQSFFFNRKIFKYGTPIRNIFNKTIGNIIGEHLDVYPITQRKLPMYCGNYDDEKLLGNTSLYFRNEKFDSYKQFIENYTLGDILIDQKCLVYV